MPDHRDRSDNQALTLDAIDLLSQDRYVAHGYPHREWAMLRRLAPVFRYERCNVHPFWAITRHADIVAVACRPGLFRSTQRVFVAPDEPRATVPDPPVLRQLLNMNPPEHAAYRSVVSSRFTARAIQRLAPNIEEITDQVLDEIRGRDQCDFATDIAARIPLAVIAHMFGIPRSDWELMFRLSNTMVGATDPEYGTGASIKESVDRARLEFFRYFTELIEDRRRNPRDDLASELANGRVNGEYLAPFELLSYFALLMIAGNETARNAMSGGLLAFIENPEQWERLKKEPQLIRSAAEEVLRWTSPVVQIARVATDDTELNGQKIRAGDVLALFYPSANRDEDVFPEPFKFDIGRYPNPHLAFGIDEHYCLGANLARLELQVVFSRLASRLESAELSGPIKRMRSSFVGGIKHMPMRCQMRSARRRVG
jgi:cholest-4-en-3-one 26-monooxygenase